MTDEPTLKQYNFLNGKGKWVEGMTKQQAHEAIALIIPAKVVPSVPNGQTTDAWADVVKISPEAEFFRQGALKHAKENDEQVYKTLTDKPKKSYELTDGNIRIGALRCAIERQKDSQEFNWDLVETFEEYIRNGK